jgi:hypothetical protein
MDTERFGQRLQTNSIKALADFLRQRKSTRKNKKPGVLAPGFAVFIVIPI